MSLLDDYNRNRLLDAYITARNKGAGKLFTLSLKGWYEIENRVANLENFEKDYAIRAGLRSGGNYLKRKGRARLKQRNYQASKKDVAAHILYNSFKVRVKRNSLGALVGFSKGGHHAHLVDLGTKKRPHPITGTSGVMPASKFWSDTAEQDWKGALDKVMNGIDRAITRIMLRRE